MDLTYSFLQDKEPTEAQLEMLMREVAEDVRNRREKADADFRELIRKEIKLAAQRGKPLIKNTIRHGNET